MYRLRIRQEGRNWRLTVGGQTIGAYASLGLAQTAASANAAVLRRHDYPCEIVIEPASPSEREIIETTTVREHTGSDG